MRSVASARYTYPLYAVYRYARMHWFPSFRCPRHGPCWFDMFYAFSSRNEGYKHMITLAVGLAFCVLGVIVVFIIFFVSYTPVFMREL